MFYQAAMAFWDVVGRFHWFVETDQVDALTEMWAV
jgi:hypothetical protein